MPLSDLEETEIIRERIEKNIVKRKTKKEYAVFTGMLWLR